jgi:hypothetical protein
MPYWNSADGTESRYGISLTYYTVSPLNAELNPIRHFLALVGVHHIVHVSGISFNVVFFHPTS